MTDTTTVEITHASVPQVVLTYESKDYLVPVTDVEIDINDEDETIIHRVAPVLEKLIEDETGDASFDLLAEWGDGNYTIKKADNSGNIYIFPKSTAG